MEIVGLHGVFIYELHNSWESPGGTILRPFNRHIKISGNQIGELFYSFPKFLQCLEIPHESWDLRVTMMYPRAREAQPQ